MKPIIKKRIILHKKEPKVKPKITLHKKIFLEYEKEAIELLGYTKNRIFLPEFEWKEVRIISDLLKRELGTSGKSLEYIMEESKSLLTDMLNLHVTQAINFICEDTWKPFRTYMERKNEKMKREKEDD